MPKLKPAPSTAREDALRSIIKRMLAVPQAAPHFTRIPGTGAVRHIDRFGGDGFDGPSLWDEARAAIE